ncbi:MAG TPA: ankyrin repeat domain-containing protein [Verrucomicrobiae bacterium]|nr:ankyrin repeat domain-containing protein [Verrucomicrobiae bacterium]
MTRRCLSILIIVLCAASLHAATRIGIIPANAEAAPLADLLTAALSSKVDLIERAELNRIAREQTLSLQGSGALRIAQILSADGLLFLDTSTQGTNALLTARLVAVQPGVIIEQLRLPLTRDLSAPAKWIATHFAPFLPKLSVSSNEALRVSVVNLRAAVSSPQSLETEALLKSLLIDRLLRHRQFFVLERERMQFLADEKEFRALDESKFWSGSYLLEGSIDREGFSPQTVTLNTRLVPPQGADPISIDLAMSRTNIPALVDALVEKIIPALKPGSHPAPWNPLEEADKYFEEAQWAYKWGLIPQAQGSAESSWALGKQTKEVAELRVRIYRDQALPVWQPNIQHKPTPENSAPDVRKLQPALRALQISNDSFANFLQASPQLNTNWFELSLRLLVDVSDLLRQFYLSPPSRIGHEDDLLQTRSLARELSNHLAAHPAYRRYVPKQKTIMFHIGNENGAYLESGPLELAFVQAGKGSYWHETPEQALQVYRELAHEGYLPHVREAIIPRPIIGWTPADLARAPRLWDGFIRELCESTNVLSRADGFYLAYAAVKKDPSLEMSARLKMYQAAVEAAPASAAAKWSDRLKDTVTDMGPHFGIRGDHEIQSRFRADFDYAIATGQTTGRFDSMREFLTRTPDLNAAAIKRMFSRGWFDENEARELYPVFEKYWTNLLAQELTAGASQIEKWREMTNAAGYVKRSLEVGMKERPSIWPTKPSATPAPTNVIQVTRFWPMPAHIFPGENQSPYIEFAVLRDGWFWMWAHNARGSGRFYSGTYDHIAIRMNPATFEYEIIPIPQERVPSVDGFEASGDFLYTANLDRVSRYSVSRKTWETLNVPPPGKEAQRENSRPFIALREAGGHVIVWTEESIMRLSADQKGVEILASRRRNPSLNIVDALPPYRPANPNIPSPINSARNNSLCTVIGTNLYHFDAPRREWSRQMSLPAVHDPRAFYPSDEGLIFYAGADEKIQWWLLRGDAPAPELLLESAPRPKYTWQKYDPKGRWLPPSNFTPLETTIAFQEGELWGLSGRLRYEHYQNLPGQFAGENNRHATLHHFGKGTPQPESFALQFEIDFELLRNAESGSRKPTLQGYLNVLDFAPLIYPSKHGLIVAAAKLPGLFFIPTPGSLPPADSPPRDVTQPVTPDSNLFFAAERNDLAAARAAIAAGAKVDARNERKWTPLMIAAKNRSLAVARFLVESGADVNARSLTKIGNHALTFAAVGGDPEIVRLLLDRGAAVNARSGPNQSCPPLYYAISRGHLPVVKLLVARGADVNDTCRAFTDGADSTMLMAAATYNHADIVNFLLDKGARLETRNSDELTAAMMTARTPNEAPLKALIQRGANINETGEQGRTALFYAAYNGRCKNIELLLAAGADPNTKHHLYGHEYNLAELASSQHFPEAAAILRAALQKSPTQAAK